MTERRNSRQHQDEQYVAQTSAPRRQGFRKVVDVNIPVIDVTVTIPYRKVPKHMRKSLGKGLYNRVVLNDLQQHSVKRK